MISAQSKEVAALQMALRHYAKIDDILGRPEGLKELRDRFHDHWRDVTAVLMQKLRDNPELGSMLLPKLVVAGSKNAKLSTCSENSTE